MPSRKPRLHNRLKDVEEKLDLPPLKAELRSFVDWIADYTLSSRGMVLRMTLRMGDLGPERVRYGVRLVGAPPQRMTPARRRVIALLSDGMLRAEVGSSAPKPGVSTGVIDGLVDEGTLEVLPLPKAMPQPPPDPEFAVPDFSPEQQVGRRDHARVCRKRTNSA